MKGVSQSCLHSVVGSIPLHFMKYSPGEVIFNAGEECTHLKFIVSGSVKLDVTSQNGRFTASQTLDAPQVLAPDYLFGRITSYPATATAIDNVGIMQIQKSDYRTMLCSDPIFLFNYLNIISTNSQKGLHGVLAVATGSLEERIAFWIVSLTQPGSRDIVLNCMHRDLYSLFGAGRSSYFATLDSMKERGIIDYDSSRCIKVLSRPALVEILAKARN